MRKTFPSVAWRLAAWALAALPALCPAQGLRLDGAALRVEPGAVWKQGGSLVVDSGKLEVNGTLRVSGDWKNNSGAELAVGGSGTVVLDGSAQSLSGRNSFQNLSRNGGGLLSFAPGAGNLTSVVGKLELSGTAAAPLALRSSAPGEVWRLAPNGGRALANLSVQDSDNVAAVIDVAESNCVDLGDNSGWKFDYAALFLAGPGGSISGDTEQSVAAGGSTSPVTPVPDLGRHFTCWTGSYSGVDSPLVIDDVHSDLTVTANFASDTFIVEFLASPGGVVAGDTEQVVSYGDSTNPVVAVSYVGHHFTGWSDGSTKPVRILRNVTADQTLTANFALDSFVIEATANAGGTVTPSGAVAVAYGSNQSFAIAADTNHYLDDVLVDGVSVGRVASYEFTDVKASHTLQAKFLSYVILGMSCSPLEAGSISPDSGRHNYERGTVVTLRAEPGTNYSFGGWYGGAPVADASAATTTLTMTKDYAVQAFFTVATPCQLTLNTVTPLGAGTILQPFVGTQMVTAGEPLTLAMTDNPSDDYSFVRWEVQHGDATIDDPGALSTTITPHNNTVVSAVFSRSGALVTATVGVDSAGGGSVSPSGAFQRVYGSTLSVKATPDSGYCFLAWTALGPGSLDLSSSNLTATLTGDLRLLASFAPDSEVTEVAVEMAAGGSPKGNGNFAAIRGGVVTLSAPALAGYAFSYWELVEGDATIENILAPNTTMEVEGEGVHVRAVFVAAASPGARLRFQATYDRGKPGTSNLRLSHCPLGLDLSGFDPKTDAVTVSFDGVTVAFPADGFRRNSRSGRWICRNQDGATLRLEPAKGLWDIRAWNLDLSDLSPLDGVDATLWVGEASASCQMAVADSNRRRLEADGGPDFGPVVLNAKVNNALAERDWIWTRIEGLVLPEGKGFDPATDAVTLNVQDVALLVPPGSFKRKAGNRYQYHKANSVDMTLDFGKSEALIHLRRLTAWGKLPESLELELYLSVGDQRLGGVFHCQHDKSRLTCKGRK